MSRGAYLARKAKASQQKSQRTKSRASQRISGTDSKSIVKKQAEKLEKQYKSASKIIDLFPDAPAANAQDLRSRKYWSDEKKEIAENLKKVRSLSNKLNKQQAVTDLTKASAGLGSSGLIARTSDGSIITDSSGNPIMTTGGREVFDQTRQGFKDESKRLFEESPELYKQMYPIAYGAQTVLPKVIEYTPGIGTLGRIAGSAFGKAQDVGSGIMGTKIAQDLSSASRGLGGDFKTMLGDLFGGFSNFVPGGLGNFSGGGGGRVQEGGDVDNIYGSRIGVTGPVTGDFIDSDGDGIDDRYQTGPGTPYQGLVMDPSQLKPEVTPMVDVVPTSIITPTLGIPSLTPTTINYASMAPQFGGYVNQGLMNQNLSPYYDNLRNYYEIG